MPGARLKRLRAPGTIRSGLVFYGQGNGEVGDWVWRREPRRRCLGHCNLARGLQGGSDRRVRGGQEMLGLKPCPATRRQRCAPQGVPGFRCTWSLSHSWASGSRASAIAPCAGSVPPGSQRAYWVGYLCVGVGGPVIEICCGALGNDRDLESEALRLHPGSPFFTVHSSAGCLPSLGPASS